MCGITGLVYFNKDRAVAQDVLKNMSDSIFHRGPDDEGHYIHQNVGLGFRRLSIIDLSTGHQPLSNQNDSIYIVFNGEIYNYLEQREKLKQKGYVYKTTTDTEVILHLYQEYGVDCLQYLRGMFAFAIWDNDKQQLFCARDRFGIKPFYYYKDNEQFVFGSEIKAILKSKNIDKTLSADALDSYFTFGYITSDLSIYKEIKKLQPAHYLLLSFKDNVTIEIKRYWEIAFEPDYSKTENYWKDEIASALSESVKLHMISDVPLGAFLSGGIDSSTVVAMMAKNSNQPIKTFSIGFKEQKYNELQYAREIANKYGCEHHEQIVEPESMSLLPKLVRAYDEPFADSSAIPTYYVSMLARKHVTVALSGDGGDELFAGYDHYKGLKSIYSSPLNFKFPGLNKFIWGNIHKMIPCNVRGKNATYFLSKNRNLVSAYSNVWTREERKRLLLNHGIISTSNASEPYKEQILKKGINNDFVTNMQNLDLQTYMVDSILTKVDRASMMNSLEVRVPLLDHIFAELTFKIPWQLKLKKNEQKYILKQSMASYLPKNILNHPKQGFGVPLEFWFKDDLKQYVNDTLLSTNSHLSSFLDKKYIENIIFKNQNGRKDLSPKIWPLLFFEEWLKQNS
ncbi:MAG TPA: asparagine synthase (glutamine-hydrolyzing) [Hanamia sp.]|nr:asparagine synthase (glutamine-hydrolyzing) [Hanamia sp.]